MLEVEVPMARIKLLPHEGVGAVLVCRFEVVLPNIEAPEMICKPLFGLQICHTTLEGQVLDRHFGCDILFECLDVTGRLLQ